MIWSRRKIRNFKASVFFSITLQKLGLSPELAALKDKFTADSISDSSPNIRDRVPLTESLGLTNFSTLERAFEVSNTHFNYMGSLGRKKYL